MGNGRKGKDEAVILRREVFRREVQLVKKTVRESGFRGTTLGGCLSEKVS